jgi:hypothetical protein
MVRSHRPSRSKSEAVKCGGLGNFSWPSFFQSQGRTTRHRTVLTVLQAVRWTCKAPSRDLTFDRQVAAPFSVLFSISPGFLGPRIQSNFENSETFTQLMTLIERTGHFCWGTRGRLETAARGSLVTSGRQQLGDRMAVPTTEIPSVPIATVEFQTAARAQAALNRLDFDAAYVPHPIQDQTAQEIAARADAALLDIIAWLTQS